ncbi:hypothetical protein FB45DRAFT_733253 [Roridomyces roridus]|uniref:Uncharacterized protein n=1 Tax=Roridomyces roridus TaxID=1738132 RepID=A0AAD7G0R5_9AGAR|nr:hypothetical protein FB45DRAFT_767676 [Roridomyces roridus]KAJ7648048.1 hypothetical protein FB45DRAFT_733253 [Roridomyces roridus]
MFDAKLQGSYSALLGTLSGKDPSTSDAPRVRWDSVLHWIVKSGLVGFASGLGALQFANNLVLAGVASPPSPDDMAQWIHLHKGYGAFRGLQLLGFNLPRNASPSSVRAAFICVYAWLDHHLSEKDKDLVDFGAIFVEQLLCKIGRWQRIFAAKCGKEDLAERARKEFEKTVGWKAGENESNYDKWPIPPCVDRSVFKAIIEAR